MIEDSNALPTGFSLHRYQVEGVLGAGGFGITYRAIHEALQNQVAIKEYFPAEWAYRDHNGTTVRANAQGQIPARGGEPPCYEWGLQRFLDEAKILVQVNHPGVVRVRDYFTSNGTAYIVMEYEEGESLSAALQRGGILPEPELRHLLDDVMPALEAVHGQGYLHRDLKPSNLYIRSFDSHVMLIDFGAARQALGRRTRSVTSVVTPGYSPIEQYVTVGEDYGPWTDIYALGAVLYRCITGAPPIEAPGRVLKDPVQPAVETGAGLYSRGLLQVIDQALAVRPEDRFQSVAAMRQALQAADQASKRADFSEVPPIKPELLELSPIEPPRFDSSSARSGPSSPSTPWPERGPAPYPRIPEQPTPPSHPSQRADAPIRPESRSSPSERALSTDGTNTFNWTQDHPDSYGQLESADVMAPLTSLQAGNADLSLPMLENIWEQLSEVTPRTTAPSSESAHPAESPIQPQPESSTPLLKRSPQSAVEHLRKVSSMRRDGTSGARVLQPESSSATLAPTSHGEVDALPGPRDAVPVPPAPEPAPIPPPLSWTRVLLTGFTVSGLLGIGLLTFEFYQAFQEQNQREAAISQRRQEEEAARRTQEEMSRHNAEIDEDIEQTRKAITSREWERARLYLDRAASANPNHPAVVAARSELLSVQQKSANSKTRKDNTTGLELVWVEGGCFNMGSPVTERDHGNDESLHQACVKGFWISKTEITNNQYRRFKPGHDSGSLQGHSLNGDTQPAVNLNWDDAQAFAEWLSWEANTDKRFRLPTEAEWEYAARAGTTTRYYWGNDIDPGYANFSDRNDPTGASIGNLDDGQAVTAPVGRYSPNALDLRDMAGNVWEWTCSEYSPNYAGEELRCSTKRPTEGQRVVRGGSWNNGPGDLRSANRLSRKPGERDATTGFRVIQEE